jgi:hypothetical protein
MPRQGDSQAFPSREARALHERKGLPAPVRVDPHFRKPGSRVTT